VWRCRPSSKSRVPSKETADPFKKNIQCKTRLRIGDLPERGKRARKNWRIYKAEYRTRSRMRFIH